VEDQAISLKTVKELRKPVAKAARTAAVILETTRNALPKQVKKGDAAAVRNNVAVERSLAAGPSRRSQTLHFPRLLRKNNG
jgi:hypothetical protein